MKGLAASPGAGVGDKRRIVVGPPGAVEGADVKTLLQLLGYRLDTVQMAAAGDIHSAVLMAVHTHWVLAAWASAAVSRIEGAQHATT